MEESVDLRHIFNMFKKKIKIIATIISISIIIGCVYTFCIVDPEYETNTILIIENNVNDSSKISTDDINVSKSLAITYSEIIKSRAVINKVIDELNLNIPYQQLVSCISVNTINETGLINIKVRYDDNLMTYKISDELNQLLISKTRLLGNENNIQILDSPVIPNTPSNSSPMRTILIAIVIGFIISSLMIFIAEYFDDKISTTEDIEKYTKLRILGVIPSTDNRKKVESDKLKFSISEAFIRIRTNIEFLNVDNNIKSILVTSTKDNEGNTSVVSQLVTYFAVLENKKILLLDCDLRNPSVHKYFDIPNKHGLTDILMSKNNIEECINFSEISNSNNQKLSIIPAGEIPLNPSELLSSQKMISLLNTLKNEYDYIFINSTSIGVTSDSSIVSNIVDAAILVVGSGQINIKSLNESKEKLLNAKTNIIGVILNKSNQ